MRTSCGSVPSRTRTLCHQTPIGRIGLVVSCTSRSAVGSRSTSARTTCGNGLSLTMNSRSASIWRRRDIDAALEQHGDVDDFIERLAGPPADGADLENVDISEIEAQLEAAGDIDAYLERVMGQ